MAAERILTRTRADIECWLTDMDGVLVLTGISDTAEIERYPFRPDEVLDSVADLVAEEPAETELPEVI